ncbi:MAG: radical SAM protein [Deltaproteobacteria bacterium]|nr:radical SAM protein [Deltaproteobacteria bacterium]
MPHKNKHQDIYITTDKIFSHFDTLYQWSKGENISPITVEIHLTERCNNRCFYCHYPKMPQSMELEDFKTAIEKLFSTHTKAIILSGGGEPTLHPRLSEAIQTTSAAGMDSAIITNLLQYDEEIYTTILEHCTWCRISLDASNAYLYKTIRGVDGFEQVMFNIHQFAKLKKKLHSQTTIGVQSVVNRYNIDDLYNEIQLTSKLGVDYIQIRPVETMPNEELIYSIQQYDHIMGQIEAGFQSERKNFKVIRSNKWDIINPYLQKREHGFSFCHAYMLIAAIDVRGDMYVCCHQIEKRNKALCYGNIFQEPIELILSRREEVIRNLDLRQCYLECRASNINRRLESLRRAVPHKNFL